MAKILCSPSKYVQGAGEMNQCMSISTENAVRMRLTVW